MAEQVEIFSHHSPYRHRVRVTILLDSGLLARARTLRIVVTLVVTGVCWLLLRLLGCVCLAALDLGDATQNRFLVEVARDPKLAHIVGCQLQEHLAVNRIVHEG